METSSEVGKRVAGFGPLPCLIKQAIQHRLDSCMVEGYVHSRGDNKMIEGCVHDEGRTPKKRAQDHHWMPGLWTLPLSQKQQSGPEVDRSDRLLTLSLPSFIHLLSVGWLLVNALKPFLFPMFDLWSVATVQVGM